ncbi:YhcN/YlaJ family sporulation lipoprotein [Cytobacillus sp. FJAT-54145]|uniref:YhcN/YlaJ family sporulation lipoprotein n=1 Tax=Cytobacillus spartinae TaxID=3299023 RepID=A0ABW6KEL0_9BACI
MKLKLFVMSVLAVFLVTGCAGDQEAQDRGLDMNTQSIRNDSNMDSTRITNTNNTNRQNDDDRMEVADEAADKVTDLEEVSQANVIVTDRNAYVAAVLNNDRENQNLSRDVENKISKAVKEADNQIRNVYVSTNPEFVDRMTGYGDRINRGEPVEGFFDEFTEMVRRVFPTER